MRIDGSQHQRRCSVRPVRPSAATSLNRSAFRATIAAALKQSLFEDHAMHSFRVALLLTLVCAAVSYGEPNHNDTRLLSQPAVSAEHIAFVYADKLFLCDLDGRNVRQLTS